MRNVTILTGFLGSGKTTLLNRLLEHQAFARSAVLVNEFGEIGIDNDLLRYSTERVAVLANGCICCAVREDVEETIRMLLEEEQSGAVEPFEHLFVETSGLADPAKLIQTFSSSPVLRSRFRLQCVAATVDATLGETSLNRFPEAARQIVLADTVLLTKADLLEDVNTVDPLLGQICAINADVRTAIVPEGELDDSIIGLLIDPRDSKPQDPVDQFLKGSSYNGRLTPVHFLDTGISSFSMVLSESLDWTAFGIWLTWLLHRHGASVLRIKGLLRVAQTEGPVAFHCVQHMVYPPEHLDHWPDENRDSRLVFITKDLDSELIQRSLRAFNGLASIEANRTPDWYRYKEVGAGSTVRGRPVRRPSAPRWLR